MLMIREISAIDTFAEQLDALGSKIPEIKEHEGAIILAGSDVLHEGSITADILADGDRTLIFAASMLVKAEIDTSEQPSRDDGVVKIVDATYREASWTSVALHKKIQEDAQRVALDALFKHKDRVLNAELSAYIAENGIMETIAGRMGIRDEEYQAPTVHVLDLLMGKWSASRYFGSEVQDLSDAQRERWQELEEQTELAKTESKLGLRGGAFTIGSEVILPERIAKTVLNDKLRQSDNFDSDLYHADGALLHEIAHGFGGARLMVGQASYGRLIEERRADYLAGVDAYGLLTLSEQLGMVFDKSLDDLFEDLANARRQGQSTSFYELAANTYGLRTMLELSTLPYPDKKEVNDPLDSPNLEGPHVRIGGVHGVVAHTTKEASRDKEAVIDMIRGSLFYPTEERLHMFYDGVMRRMGIEADEVLCGLSAAR